MKIEATTLPGAYVITPEVRGDARGFFMETYRKDVLAAAGIVDDFVQENHSRSAIAGTIRGLHFQWRNPMAKLMRVTRGKAFLVAVDLRKGSPTLGKWIGIEASEENKKQLYTPGSFARGLMSLTDDCEIQYRCSSYYDPDGEGQVRWDDPDVGIEWPLGGEPALSEKDKRAPRLKEWLARPESDSFRYLP